MTPKKPNEAKNSGESQNEKSEEFLKFEEGLRAIFSLTPEQVKQIVDNPSPKDPEENQTNS